MDKIIRHRRFRQNQKLRDFLSETRLAASDLIYPLFVIEGAKKQEEIKTLPSINRYSIDRLLTHIEESLKQGIQNFALFPVVDNAKKDEKASEAFKKNNLIHQTLQKVKKIFPEALFIADVALDPYTSHGHDGIVINERVDNDKTVALLCKQAVLLAQAGADIVAPSDMMDGRVLAIRNNLDKNGLEDKLILSYSAKYASSFYSPFRDALNNKNRAISKKTYQMDYRNSLEALKESLADIEEGADILMVKPAGYYLDIIKLVAENSLLPTFAYQVSGEYSMLKLASLNGALDFDQAMLETLYCIKRAGASKIFTYGAFEIAKFL
jgi:porphobilinogen synthase